MYFYILDFICIHKGPKSIHFAKWVRCEVLNSQIFRSTFPPLLLQEVSTSHSALMVYSCRISSNKSTINSNTFLPFHLFQSWIKGSHSQLLWLEGWIFSTLDQFFCSAYHWSKDKDKRYMELISFERPIGVIIEQK